MSNYTVVTTLLGLTLAGTLQAAELSQAQQTFFDRLAAHCGQAYEGTIAVDTAKSAAYAGKTLTMHVRECSDTELKIPFHVGENRSRTWVITKTPQGLRLKHDHRHEDGSEDEITMYGGDTVDEGTETIQSFPLDEFSLTMMRDNNFVESMQNIWHVHITDDYYGYRLTSGEREFFVKFDLSKPVATPPAPWGHE